MRQITLSLSVDLVIILVVYQCFIFDNFIIALLQFYLTVLFLAFFDSDYLW